MALRRVKMLLKPKIHCVTSAGVLASKFISPRSLEITEKQQSRTALGAARNTLVCLPTYTVEML